MKTSSQRLPCALFHAVKIEGHNIAALVFTLLLSSTFLPAGQASAQTVDIGTQAQGAADQKGASHNKSAVRGRVSGIVVVEGGKPLPQNVIIYPEIASGERRIQIPPSLALVQPDGTFTVDDMPSDAVWIRAVIRADYKYYTKSVSADGVDLTQEPLVVHEGGEVKGVRIVISPKVAVLTGRILGSEGGKPLRGASIILVPAEPHKLRIHSARLYGTTNADGGFTLTGAPGEYMALILRPGNEAYMLGDEALKARAAEGQRITLQPNERKNMDIIAPAKNKDIGSSLL